MPTETIPDTSFHERRRARLMKDPEFRAAYERATREIEQTDRVIRVLDELRVDLGVQRGEHPGDRPRPPVGIIQEQPPMTLSDVQDDRACLEQDEVAFLVGRDQAEGMKAQMRGSFFALNETRRAS